jgi:hypothetical protein
MSAPSRHLTRVGPTPRSPGHPKAPGDSHALAPAQEPLRPTFFFRTTIRARRRHEQDDHRGGVDDPFHRIVLIFPPISPLFGTMGRLGRSFFFCWKKRERKTAQFLFFPAQRRARRKTTAAMLNSIAPGAADGTTDVGSSMPRVGRGVLVPLIGLRLRAVFCGGSGRENLIRAGVDRPRSPQRADGSPNPAICTHSARTEGSRLGGLRSQCQLSL